MKRLIAYPLTLIFYVNFGLLLLIFHPIQVFCYNLISKVAQQKAVQWLNYFIIKNFYFIGIRIRFNLSYTLPMDRPVIIVSNHQSTWDIPPFIWYLRKYSVKYISKIELGKWLPSISYNLHKSGAALIDRKNPSQSVKELIRLGRMVAKNNDAVFIFPEGTRTKNGNLSPFRSAGIKTLLKIAPNAIIIPFAIKGNYELTKSGGFPLNIGTRITLNALEPIEPGETDIDTLVADIQTKIDHKLKTLI